MQKVLSAGDTIREQGKIYRLVHEIQDDERPQVEAPSLSNLMGQAAITLSGLHKSERECGELYTPDGKNWWVAGVIEEATNVPILR